VRNGENGCGRRARYTSDIDIYNGRNEEEVEKYQRRKRRRKEIRKI
jgi:hypothetical protein